jgi:integrase
MGRKSEPLYQDPVTRIWYARYYEAGKRILLSLETSDKTEAIQRHPICVNAKMGWREYRQTTSGWQDNAKAVVKKVATATSLVTLDPPQSLQTDKDALQALLDAATSSGAAKYDPLTGEWTISTQGDGDILTQLRLFRDLIGKPGSAIVTDQFAVIETFYDAAVPQLFTDKDTAARNAKIWLRFLGERKIVSWTQINDTLLHDFRLWRLKTPIATPSHPNRVARAPGERVVTRHLQYLKLSFALAVKRGLLKFNPLDMAVFPKCTTPKQQYLTLAELITLIRDPAWNQDHLTRGVTEFPLPYTFRDILLLLVVACKRRKEICFLRIEDIYWSDNAAAYREWKNESKEDSHVKAFWLTSQLKVLIKRIVGNRTSGYLFPSPWSEHEPINPDLISGTFDVVVKRVAPKKKVTLKNIRQTIYAICEDNDMPIPEIDILLGHFSVKTALPYYQDMSPRLQAKRLAPMTRKGVELLCEVLKEFFK